MKEGREEGRKGLIAKRGRRQDGWEEEVEIRGEGLEEGRKEEVRRKERGNEGKRGREGGHQ